MFSPIERTESIIIPLKSCFCLMNGSAIFPQILALVWSPQTPSDKYLNLMLKKFHFLHLGFPSLFGRKQLPIV